MTGDKRFVYVLRNTDQTPQYIERLLRAIDCKARRIGVTRQAFIKLRVSDTLASRQARIQQGHGPARSN
jgi:hypothetical protein